MAEKLAVGSQANELGGTASELSWKTSPGLVITLRNTPASAPSISPGYHYENQGTGKM